MVNFVILESPSCIWISLIFTNQSISNFRRRTHPSVPRIVQRFSLLDVMAMLAVAIPTALILGNVMVSEVVASTPVDPNIIALETFSGPAWSFLGLSYSASRVGSMA
jgi:hypothetical protein